MRQFITSAGLLILALSSEAAAREGVDFVRDVQPILQQHCVKCHGPEEQNGGMRYDDKAGAFAQGDSGGRAIVPREPDKSQLLKRITSTHKKEQMPPKGERLNADEMEILKTWITT